MASNRLQKVGGLVDLYMAEVAPDSFLKPSKFLALATALPEGARDSHDSLYLAINMYIQVHDKLGEEEKMQICCAISTKKLSPERCKQLAQNSKRDSCSVVEDGRLGARLEEMQWRLQELEMACWKMQRQMAKMTKTKSSSPTVSRSLPRLCS
ncbi:hypothetical protein HPP92_017056 [Vanilla planifolia]|uniref:NPH3 domain-containing protein n=1 Tax=Vanilla planifolia TaxID=51239 RepID=A0A835UTZ5_VANPL|nr:hypothetical protein HPP92_017056 [Vanilla planifolia]